MYLRDILQTGPGDPVLFCAKKAPIPSGTGATSSNAKHARTTGVAITVYSALLQEALITNKVFLLFDLV